MSDLPDITIHYPDYEKCTSFFAGIDKKIDVHTATEYFCALKHDADWIQYFGDSLFKLKNELSDLANLIECMDIGYGELFREYFYKEYQYILFALFDEDEDEEQIFVEKPCYVYYILNFEKDKVKIGISNDPIGRAKNIQTSSGEEIEILNTIKFACREDALEAEKFLHDVFREARKKPTKVAKSSEWFDSRICKVLMEHFSTREQIEQLKHKQFSINGIDNTIRILEVTA